MRGQLVSIPNWIYWFFLIGFGLCIVIFNDLFGESEVFGFVAFFYFLTVFFLFFRWFFRQIKIIISLKQEKAKTELLHLQSQVNPHFFFNMLNNLYGLVDKDAEKAKNLILKLSDLMRYSIYEGEKETVTLKEEITYLENYIALHKLRYHKKIDIHFHVDVDEKTYKILPLLFIILLENAFKHGVENLTKDAFVSINLIAKNNTITFEIKNNFDVEIQSEKQGIGLKNLKRRLALKYPQKHSFKTTIKENMYTSKLELKL
ncbi:sensor histidine kinase [Polaribacter porphyrae]|nr:histidine kinase [Polaribacter porphyrae]